MESRARTLTPADEMRLFAGLAVQPFVAAGVAFVGFPVFLLDRTGRTLAAGVPSDPTAAAMSVALGAGIVALFVTLVGVFPTAIWVVKRRPLTFAQALLFGVGFANLPVVLGTILSGGNWSLLRSHAFASLIGVAGAAAFWVISIRGRDFSRDRGPANTPLQPTSGGTTEERQS